MLAGDKAVVQVERLITRRRGWVQDEGDEVYRSWCGQLRAAQGVQLHRNRMMRLDADDNRVGTRQSSAV